eukprot:TRINITY_DN429_c0_g1_i5.p3 TRINITY_DN429_c0_g1~~TRINITY_DN429_c0_g1_i5.p3  ORF type:complete len:60 (+),score=24.51 TRINITY_DN429_c0_g1_i5:1358-1537(+)
MFGRLGGDLAINTGKAGLWISLKFEGEQTSSEKSMMRALKKEKEKIYKTGLKKEKVPTA